MYHIYNFLRKLNKSCSKLKKKRIGTKCKKLNMTEKKEIFS